MSKQTARNHGSRKQTSVLQKVRTIDRQIKRLQTPLFNVEIKKKTVPNGIRLSRKVLPITFQSQQREEQCNDRTQRQW